MNCVAFTLLEDKANATIALLVGEDFLAVIDKVTGEGLPLFVEVTTSPASSPYGDLSKTRVDVRGMS